MYTDIENRMISLAECKGIACEDTSIEDFEEELQAQLTKREKMCNISDYDGRRSDNSEVLKSVRSSKNYWQGFDLINMPRATMSPTQMNQNPITLEPETPGNKS